ncbi:hypothetical protein B0H19DRAFT_1383894 [Mycena capillaripes]|nr:hypothetical protein B0H19DRAFT_1383894 [Mycena capillaripes]
MSLGDSTSRSSPSTSGGTASGQIGDVDRMHRLTISPSTVELEVAASLMSIGFLVAVVVLVFWARRCRHRIYQRRLPDQFIDTQENTSQGELRPKDRDVVIPHNARPTEAPRVGLENDVLPHNELEEGPDEEAISLRMRQIEAHLAALLTVGLPRCAPPSYTGSRRNSL